MSLTTSILKGTDNNFETTSEMANGLATDFFIEGVQGTVTNTAGVAPMTGDFGVNEAGTPDMTVDVSAGVAYVTGTPTGQGSQLLRVNNSATESVTINANSTGGTRYDWVYVEIDATNSAAPNSSGTNAASLTVSRSTSASTDDGTPPTYGYPIAVVTVSNGASSIVDANITDKRTAGGPSITPDNLVTGTGTSWAWQSWTPTFTGITISGGSYVAKYISIGKTVHWYFEYTRGAGDSMGNGTISLPSTIASDYTTGQLAQGIAHFSDNGTEDYLGYCRYETTTTVRPIALDSSTSYLSSGGVTSAVPFTWTTNDQLAMWGTYEAA